MVSRGKNAAFTLVEMLVVITILGVLMSLILPAVNSVRESMRRAQCKNNLAQIGKAAQQHLAVQNHFPSSGWGYMWTGDPDHGFGAHQPGGWIYNCLPYMGLDMIHDVGKGIKDSGPGGSTNPTQNKYYALVEAKQAAITFLICPTRRKPIAYPAIENAANAAPATVLNKTDYAANGGANVCLGTGPNYTDNPTCFVAYPNCNWTANGWSDYADGWLTANFNGVSGPRSEIQAGHVTDGLSNVFFAGEKYLDPNVYYTGADGADNDTALEGNDWDVNRWVATGFPPMRDTKGVNDMSSGFGRRTPRAVISSSAMDTCR